MNIFVINFLLTLAEGWFLIYHPKNNEKYSVETRNKLKLIFVVVTCLQWVLISGLRGDFVGNDTYSYSQIFKRDQQLSWTEVFKNFTTYLSDGRKRGVLEPGYVLFEKLVSVFTTDYNVYKFIVAIVFMLPFGMYIYRNSIDPCMSFILYDALFYNMFSITGYRQVISVALGVIWGYEFIKKRKLIPFLILVLIGTTFHATTLFFIPFYFISNIKITKPYIAVVALIGIIMIIFRIQIFNVVKSMSGYEEYGDYGFKQQNFLILFLSLSLFALWRYKSVITNHPESKMYYNGLFMSFLTFPLAMVNPSAMRYVYDFAFLLMFLLPLILETFTKKEDKLILYGGIISFFMFAILLKSPYYGFVWDPKPYWWYH